MQLFPTNVDFFALFDKQAEKLVEANLLLQTIGDPKKLPAHVIELHRVEQAAPPTLLIQSSAISIKSSLRPSSVKILRC